MSAAVRFVVPVLGFVFPLVLGVGSTDAAEPTPAPLSCGVFASGVSPYQELAARGVAGSMSESDAAAVVGAAVVAYCARP